MWSSKMLINFLVIAVVIMNICSKQVSSGQTFCLSLSGIWMLYHLSSPPTGNATMLWCACSTSAFKSVTSRFIKNLACSGICAGLTCVPFDIALGLSPRCCWWLHTLVLCKAIKFLQKLYCSVTVLSFSTIALDRLAQKDIVILVLIMP